MPSPSDKWADSMICPHCMSDDIVAPSGPKNAPILIIGNMPEDRELISGKPFTGNAGAIFRAEMGRVGLDMKRMRLAYMWHHPPPKAPKEKQAKANVPLCKALGLEQLMKETPKRQVIFLVGAEPVKYFCNKSIDAVSGLKVQSILLKADLIMACVSPSSVFSGGVGEIRFAIKNFAKELEGLGLK